MVIAHRTNIPDLNSPWHGMLLFGVIPPALWATSGLDYELSSFPLFLPIPLFPTSLEEGFNPPPPSSLGSEIEWSRGAVVTYIRLFRDPGHQNFFIIFPTPFYVDFDSILPPNLEQKSIQNRSKIDPKSDLENFQLVASIFH